MCSQLHLQPLLSSFSNQDDRCTPKYVSTLPVSKREELGFEPQSFERHLDLEENRVVFVIPHHQHRGREHHQVHLDTVVQCGEKYGSIVQSSLDWSFQNMQVQLRRGLLLTYQTLDLLEVRVQWSIRNEYLLVRDEHFVIHQSDQHTSVFDHQKILHGTICSLQYGLFL